MACSRGPGRVRDKHQVRISFELEPADIARFRRALAQIRATVRSADDAEIVESAKHTLDSLPIGDAPVFVRDRVKQVQRLITMLEDEAWALSARLRSDAVDVLVYFSDPEDMIPDRVPVIGLLDDAIVLELLLRQERDLLRAYDRFCVLRRRLGPAPDDPDARRRWCAALKRNRAQLLDRVRTGRRNRGAK